MRSLSLFFTVCKRARRGELASAAGILQRPGMLILALVAALVLTGAAVGTYFAFFNKGNQTNPAQNKPGAPGRKITVDKGGGEGSAATLREALAKAGQAVRKAVRSRTSADAIRTPSE